MSAADALAWLREVEKAMTAEPWAESPGGAYGGVVNPDLATECGCTHDQGYKTCTEAYGGRLIAESMSSANRVAVVTLRNLAPAMLAVVAAALKAHERRCPLYGHEDGTRRRRVDCSDDQCRNSEHTRYVECDHSWHDVEEAKAAFAAAVREEQQRHEDH